MENDKQRLVELVEEANREAWNLINMSCCEEKLKLLDKVNEIRADYLLANGVIVLPFGIGTRVYAVITNMPFVRADVYECEVVWYALGKDGIRPTVEIKSDNIINGANLGLYLEDLFLTQEEAEQALNNIQNGNSCEGGAE